ncbi:MAG: hypothetical protein N2595_07760 [bacterium]|nr:hypothetical protein [bacterium]
MKRLVWAGAGAALVALGVWWLVKKNMEGVMRRQNDKGRKSRMERKENRERSGGNEDKGQVSEKREEVGSGALAAVARYERVQALLSGPAITAKMTPAERAQRELYFDAFNKPETIGPTKCPYDSPTYLSLTNRVLTEEEIDLILASTADVDKLFQIANDIAL